MSASGVGIGCRDLLLGSGSVPGRPVTKAEGTVLPPRPQMITDLLKGERKAGLFSRRGTAKGRGGEGDRGKNIFLFFVFCFLLIFFVSLVKVIFSGFVICCVLFHLFRMP